MLFVRTVRSYSGVIWELSVSFEIVFRSYLDSSYLIVRLQVLEVTGSSLQFLLLSKPPENFVHSKNPVHKP